ncbi:hypothetical protein C8R44DRAFT_756563 [Mycena epipterygia]|nr:hypothetical protein C8R44DRAFT_756563 [Mycena epipterygia]
MYRSKAFSGHFALGRLNEQHRPSGILFEISIGGRDPIHPTAAKSLKVLDLVRLAGLFLGILSFPLEMPTDKMPPNVTWITTHLDVGNGDIDTEDATSTLGDSCVCDWANQVLWLRIRGKQADSPRDQAEKIMLSVSAKDPEKRGDTRTLQRRFKNEFKRDFWRCEFSGDELATQVMHIIPVEMGTGVMSELLRVVRERADSYWTSLESELGAHPHDPAAPIIGNMAMLTKDVVLVQDKCINSAKNLAVGACSIHDVNDKEHGILTSSLPPVWLVNANTSHSVTAFTRGIIHDELPTAEAMPLEHTSDQERFVVRWLADAITIYMLFATTVLHGETDDLVKRIKEAIELRKDAKKKGDGEDEERKGKKRRLRKDEDDGKEEHPEEDDKNEKGGGGGSSGEPSNDGGKGNDGVGDKDSDPSPDNGTFPTSNSGGSMGGMSDSSSGSHLTDQSGLSLVCSDDAMSDKDNAAPTDIGDWPGFQHLCRLLTTPADLEYENTKESIAEDEPRVLKARSRRVLQQLFNVLEPGTDDVDRLEATNKRAVAYLAMLHNWKKYQGPGQDEVSRLPS